MEAPALSSPLDSPLGRITISSDAIAHLVGETARECYGVVGMASRGPVGKLLGKRERLTQGIQIARDPEGGVTIDLHVVVEYGLNLAEVASTIRNRVSYEAGRLTGLPVRSVEVHIDDVRRSALTATALSTAISSRSRKSSAQRSPRSRRTVAASTTSTSIRCRTATPART